MYSKTSQLQPSSLKPTRYKQREEDNTDITLSPEIKSIIRRKVSSYLGYKLIKSVPLTKQSITFKKTRPLPKQFGEYSSLQALFNQQKTIFHLYKQKIDRNLDECLYFYLKVLTLSIDYECRISEKQMDRQSSVMIDAFLFVASSLQEAGAEKAAFYFASIAITFCQDYKILHPIGQFLLIMSKISRKLFKYRESIVLLKKALEYNWWNDKKREEELNHQFLRWLQKYNADETQMFQQKFQITRIFNSEIATNRSSKVNLELKAYRDLFAEFLVSSRIKLDKITYDVGYKKPKNLTANQRTIDLELDIYSEMSFNFLQLNKKEESKLFAEKYESGYVEPQDSKIISLSAQLINSVQKRTPGWHRVNKKNFQLLFFLDIFDLVSKNRSKLRNVDQQVVISLFKIGFEAFTESLMAKEIFSYEIPLPLELKKDVPKGKKRSQGKKFIIKQRSSSHMSKPLAPVLKQYNYDKVEQNLIFNYRGIGVSRLKLLELYRRFIESLDQKQKQGSFKLVNWSQPLSNSNI